MNRKPIRSSGNALTRRSPARTRIVVRPLLKGSLGAFVPAYLKLKNHEWNDHARHLSQWELDTTLDC